MSLSIEETMAQVYAEIAELEAKQTVEHVDLQYEEIAYRYSSFLSDRTFQTKAGQLAAKILKRMKGLKTPEEITAAITALCCEALSLDEALDSPTVTTAILEAGTKFGCWTVQRRSQSKRANGEILWIATSDCGKIKENFRSRELKDIPVCACKMKPKSLAGIQLGEL